MGRIDLLKKREKKKKRVVADGDDGSQIASILLSLYLVTFQFENSYKSLGYLIKRDEIIPSCKPNRPLFRVSHDRIME